MTSFPKRIAADRDYPVAVRVAEQVRGDIVQLMLRALHGTVRDGSDRHPDKPEWEFPLGDHHAPIGELRYPEAGDIDGWQHRVYFAAPRDDPELIVWLKLGSKLTSKLSKLWRSVQDDHIREALKRFDEWCAGLRKSLPRRRG